MNMNLDRFVHRVQSSTKTAVSMAHEAFQGLDALAARDEYIHSGGNSNGRGGGGTATGAFTGSGARSGSGGDGSAAHHDKATGRRYHQEGATRVRFSEQSDEERRDPAASSNHASSSSSSCAKRGVQHGSSDQSAARNSQSVLLTATTPVMSGYTEGESHELIGGHDDNAEDGATHNKKTKKNSQRFLDDLEERVSRPMKPMQVEQSDHVVSSSMMSSPFTGGKTWSAWLPSAAWRVPATSAASPTPPAPLLARTRPPRSSHDNSSSSNGDGDPEHDEFRVKSSAAILGDDELAKLKAMTEGTDSDTAAAGAAAVPRPATIDVWQRRESFVAVTLILFLLVYYWSRDRAFVDDGM